jgi:tyrosine-specific transport protein
LKENDDELLSSSIKEDNGGSILGASLLFAGTAIGAGAIALPVETAQAGFIPSIVGLVICWLYTYVTSLVTLEASWLSSSSLSSETSIEENFGGTGFLSISKSLGVIGEIVTAMLFWFLLTAIIVAYTSEGGQLISVSAKEVISVEVNPAFGSIILQHSSPT